MKKKYFKTVFLFFCVLHYVSQAQTNTILMFVSHENTYYSEYIVMKEGLEASGYNVDVRNASGIQSSTYMVPSNATILSVANSLPNSNYSEFTNQFQDMFGTSWNSSLNMIPNFINVDGSIQDVLDMSQYDAIVIVGGTGALDYRVDGNYNSQGSGSRLISAATVQSAAEKLNALVLEALADGKPTMAQCHGASILPFCRIPGTSGPGEEALGYSLLKGGDATGYPNSSTVPTLTSLDVNGRASDRVTISSPHASFVDNGLGDFKILTTRDWYPQSVAYAATSLLNVLKTYPSQDEMQTDRSVLILHGGALDSNNCSASNQQNDVPCNYGNAPGNLPADYTHLETLLNANSPNDDFVFSVNNQNITDASLPYVSTDQNSIETYFSNYDVIIFFKHWSTGITTALQNALVSYADDGGGVLAMHHGLYNDVIGGINKDIIVNDLFGAESHESTWSADLNNYTIYQTNYGHFISTFGLELNENSSQAPATWNGNNPPNGSNLNSSFYQRFGIYDEIYRNLNFVSGQTFGKGVNDITPLYSNNHNATTQTHTTGFVKLFNPSSDESIGKAAFLAAGERRESININHLYGQVVRNAIVWLADDASDNGEALSINAFTEANSNVGIYPNPANHSITIANNVANNINSVTIINALGQKVFQTKAIDRAEVLINISTLSSGVYIVEIETENKIIKKKIIKND